MATTLPSLDIFDEISRQITELFNELIEELTQRKEDLLAEIGRRKKDFVDKIITHKQNLVDLEQLNMLVRKTSAKPGPSSNRMHESLDPIERKISGLKSSIDAPPKLKFNYYVQIPAMLRNFGSILDEGREVDYPNLFSAIQVFGGKGNGDGEFLSPLNLHMTDNYLYVCDSGNKRIQIFDTVNWAFSHEFRDNDNEMEPYAATTDMFYLYVTYYSGNDGSYMIGKFDKNFNLEKSQSETAGSSESLKQPYHVVFTPNNEILVADGGNDRVCVFDTQLFYRREFGWGVLKTPRHIQCVADLIYVLNTKSHFIQVFNMTGQNIKSLLPNPGGTLRLPISFSIDPVGNFIIADLYTNSLKIFSSEEELLQEVGRGSLGSEDVTGCYGVLLSQHSQLIVSCGSPLHCIKIF